MIQNREKLSKLQLHKHRVLTGIRFFVLGAIAGSISAFGSYEVIFSRFHINFHPYVILVCLILGAFFGICVTFIANDYDRFRGIALGLAFLIGLTIPFFAYLILSFLAGPS